MEKQRHVMNADVKGQTVLSKADKSKMYSKHFIIIKEWHKYVCYGK